MLKSYNTFVNESVKLNSKFKKWFKGSKIIDNKNKPLICYHGSPNKDIKIFDVSKSGYNSGNLGHYGYGVYFSMDIKEANIYGTNIYQCYINMQKPFIGNYEQLIELKNAGMSGMDPLVNLSIKYDSIKNQLKKYPFLYKFAEDWRKKGERNAWDNIDHDALPKVEELIDLNDFADIIRTTDINKDYRDGVHDWDLEHLESLGITPEFNIGFEYVTDLHWITDLGDNVNEFTDIIMELGYDGVWYGSEIVAFKPNQIKSIDNDGSWDNNDDNIYS